MKKAARITGYTLLGLLFVAYNAWQFRTDPIDRIPGKRLSGEEVAYPADWSFTEDYPLIAVESRVDNPHSVTTVCFLYRGDLHVPAREGATKDWTRYVLADPRARIKVGDKVYPVRLTRVTDFDTGEVLRGASGKYPWLAGNPGTDTWLFRVSAR